MSTRLKVSDTKQGAPKSYLGSMLSKWVQFCPLDARGSKDVVTLKFAVDSAGFSGYAKKLTLEYANTRRKKL